MRRGLKSSGSMEPAFQRGDLLFLTNYESDPIRVGEILVFKVGSLLVCGVVRRADFWSRYSHRPSCVESSPKV